MHKLILTLIVTVFLICIHNSILTIWSQLIRIYKIFHYYTFAGNGRGNHKKYLPAATDF